MAARNIIRFVNRVNVSFSVSDTRAAGASEFYRQLTAEKTRKVNPKCSVKYTPILAGNPATIDMEFINGRKENIEVENTDVRMIFEDVDSICSEIETEYEKQGKVVD